MAKIVNLYLYRLQKEVKEALEKGNSAVTPSPFTSVDPENDDFYFYYGEHLCLDQIQHLIKSEG